MTISAFASLDETSNWAKKCAEVTRQLSDEYHLDDLGYWSTKNKYSFSKSMLKVTFNSFTSTEDDYRDTYMPLLHKEVLSFQKELSGKPWDYSLIRMVIACYVPLPS